MKRTTIPNFKTKGELFKFLKDNQELLITEKKMEMKRGECIPFLQSFLDLKDGAYKSNLPVAGAESLTDLKVKAIINTTNWLDRHKDVHIPGLWKKSLSENKRVLHLQEHECSFDHIISSNKDLKAVTEKIKWTDLGYAFDGNTEALVFYSTIRKTRNPFMFDQYAKGYVDNHSVGMQYVAMVMCIDDEDPYYGAEKEAWDKYYPMVVNQDAADESGYFWAIKEAKVIEGSAVPIGSNIVTPTLDNNMKNNPDEPGNHSNGGPQKRTQVDRLKYLADNFKL